MDKPLTIEYITGFFDADGSVSLMRAAKNEHKSPTVAFHNNERVILEKIKAYFGFVSISKKKARKPTHKDSYDLKMAYNKAMLVLAQMRPYILHPKKKHRTDLILEEYLSVTDRQGNYSGEMLIAKYDFEERFFQDSK